ncbi:MbeD/MobD family mobilization/exclusion protein [Escherichia coli]
MQQDYTQRLKDWESAFTDLQRVELSTTGERATEGTVRRLEFSRCRD